MKPLIPSDMTLKLKELLEKRRKARAGDTTAPATIKVQTDTDAPIIVLTALDRIVEDEFSKYF